MKIKNKIFALGAIAMMATTSMTSFADTTKDTTPELETTQIQPRQQWAVVNANSVNMRKTPGTSGAIIRQLHKGYRVTDHYDKQVWANNMWWQKVSYGSQTGWVADKYLNHEG